MTETDEALRATTGFSLVEMLVVIAILAMVLGLAYPSFVAGMSDARRLQVAAADVINALRLARTSAVSLRRQREFVIDVEARTFELVGARTQRFPRELTA